jgi:hypothetical protein
MNITPGTALWAIQQMLEGKKIRCKSWGPEEYIYIKDDVIFAEDGDVQPLTHSMLNYDNWLLWSPPNLYPKGTFAWAWEEIQRGGKLKVSWKDVTRHFYKKRIRNYKRGFERNRIKITFYAQCGYRISVFG